MNICARLGSKNPRYVVLKMITDTREIYFHVNVGSSQHVPRSDPALHQDIGTCDRTSGQDENDLGNGSIWQDLQVITRRQRVDISNARVRTSPVGGIDGRRGDESPRR